MSKFNTKILMLAGAAVVALPVAVIAAPTSVESTATFRAAVSLQTNNALEFSIVDYASPTVTGADTVVLNPQTGAATYNGQFSAGTGAAVAPGEVEILTSSADPASVYCSTSATLTDGGGNTIGVTGVNFYNGTSVVACAGTGTGAGSFTLTAGGGDLIQIGGTLDGATASGGTIVPANYSTANAGGSAIQVDVIYD